MFVIEAAPLRWRGFFGSLGVVFYGAAMPFGYAIGEFVGSRQTDRLGLQGSLSACTTWTTGAG